MTGNKFAPNPFFAVDSPEVFTNMGLTAENVAAKYEVGREDQDQFALRSNRCASAAVESGLFDAEIVPIEVEVIEPGPDGKPAARAFTYQRDEGPRGDTTLEALSKLKPAFKGGTGGGWKFSQMSDGRQSW
jgi:acetyl-CoA acyltransferase